MSLSQWRTCAWRATTRYLIGCDFPFPLNDFLCLWQFTADPSIMPSIALARISMSSAFTQHSDARGATYFNHRATFFFFLLPRQHTRWLRFAKGTTRPPFVLVACREVLRVSKLQRQTGSTCVQLENHGSKGTIARQLTRLSAGVRMRQR